MVSVGGVRAADTIEGYASVLDGDRIDVQGRRIRLVGIDAPELRQTCSDAWERLYRCGQDAEVALAEKIVGRRVACERAADDRDAPAVALCRLDGEDLGGWLVDRGLAVADRTRATGYGLREDAARQAKRGLWAGSFTMPWDLRRGVRGRPDGYAVAVGTPLAVAPTSAPTPEEAARKAACRIKGNITREGTKLYWVPGSRRYAETVIAEAAGERWFCSEDEAKAAGWLEPAREAPPN